MTELSDEQIELNFSEINPKLSAAEAVFEANRCLYCFDAPCMHACPTHIDVPAFIKKIASGNLHGSARVIFDANPIGASCARVCPVEVLCEGACVEKTLMAKPIEIGRLQRYATDYAIEKGRQIFRKGEPNGKSVGIVGSGPAGLSCATYLARLGYDVTVYERRSLAGGLDTYGMAEYKMTQKDSLDEVEAIRALGVEFRLSCEIIPDSDGEIADSKFQIPDSMENELRITNYELRVASDEQPTTNNEPKTKDQRPEPEDQISFPDLRAAHDAIFLGVGLGATNDLGIKGEDLDGVLDALRFIELVKTRRWETIPLGKTVCVIGAGNTAIDAVTQAKRLGAERVLMIYRRTEKDISAYEYEYELAKKDGVEFLWQTAPVEILTDETGTRAGVLCCRKTDNSHERFEINCDLVIKAIGQKKQSGFFQSLGLETDEKGRVATNELMQTSDARIFAGGDCVNGGAEAVDAAQMGKLAARGIHFALFGEKIELAGAQVPVLESNHHH